MLSCFIFFKSLKSLLCFLLPDSYVSFVLFILFIKDGCLFSFVSFVNVGEWGWGVEGSRLEAWMKSHKSEVAIT